MNDESPPRSTAPSNPVDPTVVRVLRLLDPAARRAGCAYFVAGATARDLILVNVYGLRPGRATQDLDLGVAVENWTQFEGLKESLVETREFTVSRAKQRLIHTDQTTGFSMPVDLFLSAESHPPTEPPPGPHAVRSS
jgi:predicted nucleotidyltransferase